VIDDRGAEDPLAVRRVLLVSGKFYYTLLEAREARGIAAAALVRTEQLYPFPHDEFQATIDRYAKAKEVLWCQEEPGNQGAWHRIQHYLLRHMRQDQVLAYAMRKSSASPAVGYLSLHIEQQKELVATAFAPIADNLVLPVQGTARRGGTDVD